MQNILNFKKSNDKVVYSSLAEPNLTDIIEKRGKHVKTVIVNGTYILIFHIESFHLNVFHYRWKHASLSRYLPSDINIKSMYEDFCQKHPEIKISYTICKESN